MLHRLPWQHKSSSQIGKDQGEVTLDWLNLYAWKIPHAHLHIKMGICVKFQDDQFRNVEEVCSTRFVCYISILQWNVLIIQGKITLDRLDLYTWKICHAHLHTNINGCVKFQVDLIRNSEVVPSTNFNGYVRILHKKAKFKGRLLYTALIYMHE